MSDEDDTLTSADPSEEKAFWHAMWPLSPPPPRTEDVKLLASAQFEATEGWTWRIFLMGRPGSAVDVIGASFPTEVMKSGERFQRYAGDALNRAFSALSSVVSSETRLLEVSSGQYFSFGMYSDAELPQTYGIHIQMPSREVNWDLHSVMRFVSTETISTEFLSVLSEATHEAIPRHYRFLSLCRALELLIPADRERSQWLENYERDFRALDVDLKRFRNYVPELRNRCAHGKAGTRTAFFGHVGPSKAVPTSVFNLLMRAVIDKVAEVSAVQLSPPVLNDEVPTPMPA